MAELAPPPPPPPPIISPAPPSDDDEDEYDDKATTESSEESETDSDATPIPSSIPVPPPPPPPPVAPSEPVTSADVMTDETPAPVKDDRKLWERPWSLKELKNATECWTLAADAGLLLFMKEFSQKVVSKTHEIEKQVDSLIHEAKNTDTRAGNIFNDFMMLSNIQFVENRVYEENEEEEDEEKKEKVEAEKTQSEERSPEEKQIEVVGRIREAVSCGLKVLDEAFTKLEVEDEASSDEDDEAIASYHEPILEAKDPYALRPMPYLIGTSGFFQSDDVGIGEFESEGEEEEEEEEYSTDEEEESQSRQPKTRGVMEDDSSEEELFEPSDKESEEGDKRGGVAEPFSSSSSSDEGSSSAEEFSSEDDNEGTSKRPAMIAPVQLDFHAELAAKLGMPSAAPVTTATGEGSEFESSIAPSESVSGVGTEKHGKKKRKKKKHKDKGLTEDDHGKSASKSKEAGLFVPEEDEDEGTPFGHGDNIFGTSKTAKGLFDESEDEEKESSGAFAGKKSNEEPSEDADKESLHSSMSKSSKKKLPAGAVPMFGAPPGLFTPEDEKSVTFDDVSTVKSEGSPLTAKKKDGSSLFDDEDDDDAERRLFSTKKKSSSGSKASPTVAPKPRRHKSSTSSDVFDDKEGSGLFSSGQPHEGTAAGSPSRKKKPVGGVSIFGPQPSFLTESLKASSKSSFAEDDSEAPGFMAEDSSVVSQPITSTAPIKTAPAPTATTSSSAGLGLFDDSGGEEDLFTTLATQKPKPKGKAPVGGISIFGAITDELTGGMTSTEPAVTTAPVTAPTKSVTSTVTSKKSGGLFSDGTESDEDGLFSTKLTTTAAPNTSTETIKPITTSSKDPFGIGSDEEDNLFPSAPVISKPPASTQPAKAEEPKVATKPKTKTSKDIFDLSDDDGADNLFASALTSKPKSAEKKQSVKAEQKTTSSAPSVKKKPVARLGGLFDNDEDDDELFGTSNFGFGIGASKPSTTKASEPPKSSKPGLDLLSDTPPEEDDLFTTKPTPTAKQPKASVPPPTKTKQTAATDDLFTASVDSGNVVGEQPQNSPDVPTEPAKPQKKKPAGAVPMFGGVDLFGGGGLGNKETVPVTTAAPTVEDKQETMPTAAVPTAAVPTAAVPTAAVPTETKKSFGGLFGSPTSEDDDIFSFKPKKAPVKTPVKEPQPQPQQQDDLFTAVKPSKLKSAVSFDAPAMKSPTKKVPTMEKSVSFEEPKKSDTLANFTKNRAVRQGGRRPPSRQTVKAQSGQSDDAMVGFTSDTPSPSTQRNPSKLLDADPLGFGGTGSKPDTVDDLFTASSTVLPPTGGSRTTTKKAKKPVPRPAPTKETTDITKDILFGNDDMLAESPPKETAAVVDQKRVTEIEKQIQKEIQEDDDLFGTKALSKNLTSTIGDDLFGTSTTTKPTVTTTTSAAHKNVPPVHEDDDDDELFPSKPAQPSPAAAATTTTTTTTIPNKDTTDAPLLPPAHKVDGDVQDELFPSDDKKKPKKEKTVVKKKKAPVTDEDLFGDTDDIFGNVPKDTSKPAATGKSTKAKTGKGKKKKKASSAKTTATEVTATVTTEPVTDVHDGVTPAAKLEPSTTETPAPTKENDFEDSLFGETAENAKKAKAMKKKPKKKSEPKDYSMFDTDAPSIFDDPLNADK